MPETARRPGPARGLRRENVSFARRDGRHSHRHPQAWDAEHARWRIEPPRPARELGLAPEWTLDPRAEFGRVAPLVVEIGSGTGDAAVAAAGAHPEADVVAVDVYRPGLARTIVAAERLGLDNLRILEADGRALLETGLPAAGVDEIRLFFPDPWPKTRHRKRRLVDEAFVTAVARVLRPGGVLRMATDWADYADVMLEVAGRSDALENAHGSGFAPRFEERPTTRFEGKGEAVGRRIRDLTFVRRGGRSARR